MVNPMKYYPLFLMFFFLSACGSSEIEEKHTDAFLRLRRFEVKIDEGHSEVFAKGKFKEGIQEDNPLSGKLIQISIDKTGAAQLQIGHGKKEVALIISDVPGEEKFHFIEPSDFGVNILTIHNLLLDNDRGFFATYMRDFSINQNTSLGSFHGTAQP